MSITPCMSASPPATPTRESQSKRSPSLRSIILGSPSISREKMDSPILHRHCPTMVHTIFSAGSQKSHTGSATVGITMLLIPYPSARTTNNPHTSHPAGAVDSQVNLRDLTRTRSGHTALMSSRLCVPPNRLGVDKNAMEYLLLTPLSTNMYLVKDGIQPVPGTYFYGSAHRTKFGRMTHWIRILIWHLYKLARSLAPQRFKKQA